MAIVYDGCGWTAKPLAGLRDQGGGYATCALEERGAGSAPGSLLCSSASVQDMECLEVCSSEGSLTGPAADDDDGGVDALLAGGPAAPWPVPDASFAPGGPAAWSAEDMRQLLEEERIGYSRLPRADVMELQQGITAGDRASVVDHLTRCATQLQLGSDVLFLAVGCLDRLMSAVPLDPELLDTAALACLRIAAKFEHCVVAPATQFLAAAQADFTSSSSRRLLVDMEARVLEVLDYRVNSYPTTKTFLRAIFSQHHHQQQQLHLHLHHQHQHHQQQLLLLGKAGGGAVPQPPPAPCGAALGVDPRVFFCASYLAEMSLLEAKLAPFPPSEVAAAAFASANLLVRGALRDEQLTALTGYSLCDIKQPMQWLLAVHHVLYESRNLPPATMYETARKYRHASVCHVGLVPSISSTTDPRLRLSP